MGASRTTCASCAQGILRQTVRKMGPVVDAVFSAHSEGLRPQGSPSPCDRYSRSPIDFLSLSHDLSLNSSHSQALHPSNPTLSHDAHRHSSIHAREHRDEGLYHKSGSDEDAPCDGTLGSSTVQLTPQHVRQNRPVSHRTSQSPHPAGIANNDVNGIITLSPRVVPSPPWQSSAIRHVVATAMIR
jgi:hypothetical protein